MAFMFGSAGGGRVRCLALFVFVCGFLTGCGFAAQPKAGLSVLEATSLATTSTSGDSAPVRDPSIAFQNGTYYLFSTDPADPGDQGYVPIRCSADRLTWKLCGHVFSSLPSWVPATLPGVQNLWAPDISYFNGLYHLYYSASTLRTQQSGIAFATNTTLDPSDPSYRWVDHGEIIASHDGDDFNAIDPNIVVDAEQRVWLTYGSFWTGIKQVQIDPASGAVAQGVRRMDLAYRPDSPDHAEEGSSLIQHGRYYYLFLSVDHCCAGELAQDDYKEIVGRSMSPNGPFLDAEGVDLMEGGGSILLAGNGIWIAPGGGTAYNDPQTGQSVLVFHALDANSGGTATLWSKKISWLNDWPYLN